MFKRLIAFLAVAEERSFSAAAKRLNIAQPWLSVQVKQLEEQLGFEILARNKRSVRITSEGERILALAQKLKVSYDDLYDEANRIRRGKLGHLKIGCEPSTVHDVVRYRIIQDFIRKNPGSEIKVCNESPDQLFSDLINRNVNVIYTPLSYFERDVNFIITSRHKLVLLSPSDHPIAKKSILRKEDLVGLEVLTGSKRYMEHMSDPENAWLSSRINWIEPPEIEYESRQHMVKMLGIPALWIDYPISPFLLPEGLSILHFENPIISLFGFASLKDDDQNVTRRFMKMASKYAVPNAPISNGFAAGVSDLMN